MIRVSVYLGIDRQTDNLSQTGSFSSVIGYIHNNDKALNSVPNTKQNNFLKCLRRIELISTVNKISRDSGID